MKKGTTFRHLNWTDRMSIERMTNHGFAAKDIAVAVGCHINTIYNEWERATYMHTNGLTETRRYNPDGAEARYRKHLSRKGAKAILAKDEAAPLREYIRYMICELKYSPEAVLHELKKNDFFHFRVRFKSVNTLYAAIRKGYIKDVKMESLPRHGKTKKKPRKRVVRQKQLPAGTSIEKRPEEVNCRETFGHWEMDCVEGSQKSKKALLVLTERKTRYEIIEVLKSQTMAEVCRALNRIEKLFKKDFFKIFKTITVDNGSEFKDAEGMEKALYRVGKRSKFYYCHAMHPEERGSNENANHLVRRWYPKGTDFDKALNKREVKDVEFWINTYPRGIFDGDSALERFTEELTACGCRLDPLY